MRTFHLDATLRFVEPGPAPETLYRRTKPQILPAPPSLLETMRRKAAEWVARRTKAS